MALLEAMQGNFEDGRRLVRESGEILDELGLAVLSAGGAEVVATIEFLDRKFDAAENACRAGLKRLDSLGESMYFASVAAILCQALYEQGDLDGAWAYADQSQAAADHDVAAVVHWRGTKAKILSERNQLGPAVELARSAVDLATGTDLLDLRGEALQDYAAVLTLVERHEEAKSAFKEALRCFQQKGNRVSAARASLRLAAMD